MKLKEILMLTASDGCGVTPPIPPRIADSNRAVIEALAAVDKYHAYTAANPGIMGHDDGGPIHPNPSYDHTGMTLRQWYAGQALVGFQSYVRGGWSGTMTPEMADDAASNCFALADAMIRVDS